MCGDDKLDASKLRRFEREAQQRIREIQAAVAGSEALGWFAQYGRYLVSSGPDGASVKVHLNYASSTAYVDRAQAYLDRAARLMLPEIVARAKALAENDYERGMEAGQTDAPTPLGEISNHD